MEETKICLNSITMKYKIEKEDKDIFLFGSTFVRENKNKNFKLVLEGKELDLVEVLDLKNYNIKDFLEIKLIGDFTKIAPREMFFLASNLLSVDGISNWDTTNFTDIAQMFHNCHILEKIPDISAWDTKNIEDMNHLFDGCNSITSLPDISNWNTSKVKKNVFYVWKLHLIALFTRYFQMGFK